jgi:hypothetical protein
MSKYSPRRLTAMNDRLSNPESRRRLVPSDLSESLDVRLVVAGRLSKTAIPVRHDREELAAILGDAQQRRPRRPR